MDVMSGSEIEGVISGRLALIVTKRQATRIKRLRDTLGNQMVSANCWSSRHKDVIKVI